MNIQSIPEHELARLREKAKEVAGSRDDYSSFYTELLTRRLNGEPLQYIEEYIHLLPLLLFFQRLKKSI